MQDRGARQAVLLGSVLLLVLLPSNVPAAALPLLRAEWDTSGSILGAVVGAYQLGYAVAVLLVLPLTDRLAARRVMLASIGVTVAASIALPLVAHDPLTAILLRVLAGGGLAGVYMPGVRLVAAAAVPARRGRAVGIYVASFYLGSSLSLLVTGVLLAPVGWRGAAVALGGTAALAAVIALAARLPLDRPAGRARLDPQVLREPRVLRTILAYGGHSWELYVMRGWLAAFLAVVIARGGTPPVAAAAAASQWAAAMLGFGILGVPLGGALSDRFGRARTAAGFAFASGVVAIGIGALETAPVALIVGAGCVLGLLISGDSAVYSTAITEAVPPHRLGSAQAMQASFGFATGAIAPAVAGAVLDLGVGWVGVFAAGGVASLAAGAVLLYRPRSDPGELARRKSRRPA